MKYKSIVLLLIIILFTNSYSQEIKVKNVILFIGDGMGNAHLALTYYTKYFPADKLSIYTMPVSGLVSTYSADNLITDSAAGGTAIATGYKTNNKFVGVTPDSVQKTSIMEAAQKNGYKVGLVVISSITDATPASFLTHVPARSMHTEIASQLINKKPNILVGDGREYFVPQNTEGSERKDDINLIDSALSKGFFIANTSDEYFNSNSKHVLYLLDYPRVDIDKSVPSLASLTKKAIELISEDDKPFFLVVEGSQIDWAGHDNSEEGIINQVVEFDNAVKEGLRFAENNGETLILVTADHETGGLTIVGYDKEKEDYLVNFSSKGHTSIHVPIFAYGPSAFLFSGFMDNTQISQKIAKAISIKFK